MSTLSRLWFTALILTTLSACTWVKLDTASHKIALREKSQVVNCVKKGTTTAKTLAKLWFIPRLDQKVRNELITVAKNEAVVMGGDTIVPESGIDEGEQTFGVYQCQGR